MSELTRCNHCTLQALRRRYGDDHVEVRQPSPATEGWVEVHVDGRRVASMKVLTTHCVC